MEFEFTASIYIDEDDLQEMCLRVKKGEEFLTVFDNVMAKYDDFDYYGSGYIFYQVKAEIDKRLAHKS